MLQMRMALDPENQSITDSPYLRDTTVPCGIHSGGSRYLQQHVTHLDGATRKDEGGLLLPLALLLSTVGQSAHLVNEKAQLLQNADLKRLSKMQVESRFGQLACGLDVCITADCDQDRRFGYNETLDPSSRLVAIHAWHGQVQQGYLGSEGIDRGNGLRPTRGRLDLVPGESQQGSRVIKRIVIDHQHAQQSLGFDAGQHIPPPCSRVARLGSLSPYSARTRKGSSFRARYEAGIHFAPARIRPV